MSRTPDVIDQTRSMDRRSLRIEVWPVGHFIRQELHERKWTRDELLKKLGGGAAYQLAIDLLLDAPRKGVLIGRDLAADVARVFGTSAELWINLDKAWQDHK